MISGQCIMTIAILISNIFLLCINLYTFFQVNKLISLYNKKESINTIHSIIERFKN